ncbi:hypothetical protein [Bifidobacterium aquikefiri]
MNHLYADETPPERDTCPYCGGALTSYGNCPNRNCETNQTHDTIEGSFNE